jgi:acyl-CoA synthetase (AMP-forming)/AMP-acid ligase II
MAGIQVFFQALLNGSSTVRLFNLPKDYVFNEIANYKITHISATPTFYRLLLPHHNKYESVKRITSGGEKFSEVTIESLKDVFPEAKINNIYALTEAGSLFASNNNIFTLLPEYSSLVKIEGNRLLLNKVLLGDNLSQLEWYDTGDLVEIISLEPLSFSFTSREKEIINTGGFKVNPTEVEEIILTFPGVTQAHVYPKKSSILGQIICCNLVIKKETINESELRLFLSNKLQEFKIPRLFNFVEDIKTTRTGKLQRN